MTDRELDPDDHRRMARKLREPSRFPHPVDTIETVETHISTLLLTETHAYKLKKPLDLGFLDFTSLERRRAACDEELRINRRLAPEFYLQRIAITGTPEDPVIGGQGPTLDWAVQMSRFDDSRLFDRLCETSALTSDSLEDVARQVAEFHQTATVAAPDSEWGTIEAIAEPARDNLTELQDQLGSEARLDRLSNWTEACLSEFEQRFQDRRAAGRVRECHGDLHLGNIVDVDGRAVIFDGIEFAPELRWIDVINEVAFLDMDLRQRQRPDLAAVFLSAYFERTGDYDGVALLPFYRAYRALVRAKVSGLRADDPDADTKAREKARQMREAYIAVAEAQTRPPAPRLLLMHGLSGSGKSTVARAVVERLDALRLRSDVERKRLAGLDANTRAGAGFGEGLYGPEQTEKTYQRLEGLAAELLEAGTSVVVDAASLRRKERERFRRLAGRAGVAFTLVVCDAPETRLRERIAERQQTGTDPSDADTSVLDSQIASYQPPAADEQDDRLVIDTENDPGFAALDNLQRQH